MSYMIFNPLSGQHEEASSLEEAIDIRKKCITDFIDSNIHVFSVVRVDKTEDGTTWVPIEMTNDFFIKIL